MVSRDWDVDIFGGRDSACYTHKPFLYVFYLGDCVAGHSAGEAGDFPIFRFSLSPLR